MTSVYSVNVAGVSSSTTEEKLHDFFSFCGKITSIDRKDDSAIIQFEKLSAAKTALMLSGGNLDDNTLHVSGENLPHEEKEEKEEALHANHIDQHEKPRAGIAAEYLAHGYRLTDDILHRLIEVDAKQGISKRFLNYMQQLDTGAGERALGRNQTISGKLQATVQSATQQAKAIDQQKGYSKVANDYYSRALASPWGLKVKAFYTTTTKQVQDIHEEARRIADQHKQSKVPAEPQDAPGSAAAPDPTTQEEEKTAV